MFAFVAAHRAEVFPDADYADLFAPPGAGQALPDAGQAGVVVVVGRRRRHGLMASSVIGAAPRWCQQLFRAMRP